MVLESLVLFAGVLSLGLALIILFNGTSKKGTKIPFVLFAGSVGLWSLFISLFSLTNSQGLAQLFVIFYYSSALLISYAFLLFALEYVGSRVSRFTGLVALIPWVAMTVFVALPGYFITSIDVVRQTVQLEPFFYGLYTSIFVIYVLIGLGSLWKAAFLKRGAQKHGRVLFYSLTVCFLGGAYFNLFLPLIGVYSLITLGPLFSIVMVATVFYAIARHGLFDIRRAVVRTVTYLMTLATLAGIYLVIAFLVFDQLLGQTTEANQIFLNVSLTILLALIFQPIKRFFDRATSKVFYKDSYDVDEFYSGLNKALSSTTDLRILLRVISNQISVTFKAEYVSLVLLPRNYHYVVAGSEGHKKLSKNDAEEVIEKAEVPILASEVADRSLKRLMQSHRVGLLLPIFKEGAVMGVLCLGDHKNSDYTKRDIRVLETITDELSIAIQNALSIQEVKDINATLQQRIDAATKELRASNAQLQKLDEAKDEFISMASHQLRTPLTSIKGYISMLVEGDVGAVTKDQKHLLEQAFGSSERMVRLIGDFLNVSRLQTGKFVIDKKPVNLAALVQSEVDGLESNAATRQLKFVYKRPAHFPDLMIDENKFQQVIMNFSDNAIYYSKENSKIVVTLREVNGMAEFTVKDTGIGVPADQQAQLFSKFFRATNARLQRPDGTGVGLFLAKKVIDAHGGTVVFESKEGKGSTFGFRLPIKKLRA